MIRPHSPSSNTSSSDIPLFEPEPFASPPPKSMIKQDEKLRFTAPGKLNQVRKASQSDLPNPTNTRRVLFSKASFDDSEKHPEYYIKKECAYKFTDNVGEVTTPVIFQPTPEGLQVLIETFNKDKSHRFEVFNHTNEENQSVGGRFTEAKGKIAEIFPTKNSPVALILSSGQAHAYPLLLVSKELPNEETEKYIIVFDSTCNIKDAGYKKVAHAFPEYKILLNKGNRQQDAYSCITDAFEILCQTLETKDIENQIIKEAELLNVVTAGENAGRRVNRFVPSEPPADNLYVFKMPAELCITSQRSQFLTANNVDIKKKFVFGGKKTSIEKHIPSSKKYSPNFVLEKNTNGEIEEKFKILEINHYLYDASFRHKKIIDAQLLNSKKLFPTSDPDPE